LKYFYGIHFSFGIYNYQSKALEYNHPVKH
jgi:hypothetical protein